MSRLPDVIRTNAIGHDFPARVQQAAQQQRQAELAIYQHGLAARVRSECDCIDSRAIGDAMRTALNEELDLLEYGLQLAGANVAKATLVARKVELLASMNNQRITRRFGG